MFLELLHVHVVRRAHRVVFVHRAADSDDAFLRHLTHHDRPLRDQLLGLRSLLISGLAGVVGRELVAGFEPVRLLEVDGEVGGDEFARLDLQNFGTLMFRNHKEVQWTLAKRH